MNMITRIAKKIILDKGITTINILQEYFNLEYIWYVRNRNYDAVLGLAILAYNLCVMFIV
ncbi:hypothetical protein [Kosmotoga arenicorallina]|uniref:hypothetical protein n=1 Tax=Kosmotoga arenicorallina TaxID=688066 RepID=UPI00129084ED|nr:hypothetical protein [Kosmotoga arenicorallina]